MTHIREYIYKTSEPAIRQLNIQIFAIHTKNIIHSSGLRAQ